MGDTETAEPTFDQSFDKAFEDAKAETEKSEVTAGDTETTQTEQEPQSEETDKAADQTEETAEEPLLSAEEEAEVEDDPAKLRKALQRSYTQKTQKLAAERKELEAKLESADEAQQLANALKENPQETIKWLQQHYGGTTGETAAQTEETAAPKMNLRDVLMEQDPEQLATKLDQYIDSKVGERTSELQNAQARTQEAMLIQQAEKDLKEAATRHTDWDEHFPEVAKMMSRFQPAPGSKMDAGEYYDTLYNLVTLSKVKETAKSQGQKETIERIRKSSQDAEKPTSGVKEQIVTPAMPKNLDFDAAFDFAFAAAKKGQRLE